MMNGKSILGRRFKLNHPTQIIVGGFVLLILLGTVLLSLPAATTTGRPLSASSLFCVGPKASAEV